MVKSIKSCFSILCSALAVVRAWSIWMPATINCEHIVRVPLNEKKIKMRPRGDQRKRERIGHYTTHEIDATIEWFVFIPHNDSNVGFETLFSLSNGPFSYLDWMKFELAIQSVLGTWCAYVNFIGCNLWFRASCIVHRRESICVFRATVSMREKRQNRFSAVRVSCFHIYDRFIGSHSSLIRLRSLCALAPNTRGQIHLLTICALPNQNAQAYGILTTVAHRSCSFAVLMLYTTALRGYDNKINFKLQ